MIIKIKDNIPALPGLSKTRTYEVVALMLYWDGRSEVRVLSDGDSLPALYPLLKLDIVNGDIPEGWCVVQRESGSVELLPKEWSYHEFWARFFDGDREAEEAFRRYFASRAE